MIRGVAKITLGTLTFSNPYINPFKVQWMDSRNGSGSPTLRVNDTGSRRFPFKWHNNADRIFFFKFKLLYGLHRSDSTLAENSLILASYSQRHFLIFFQNRLRLLLILRVDTNLRIVEMRGVVKIVYSWPFGKYTAWISYNEMSQIQSDTWRQSLISSIYTKKRVEKSGLFLVLWRLSPLAVYCIKN